MDITGPCGLLGEKDLFLRDRRTLTAEAMEDSVVCFVKKEDFLGFLRQNPEVAVKMIEQISSELQQAEEKIEALTVMDSKRRVADLLLRLAKQYGREKPEGTLIEITLTREEMAEMIGTTQETVIRVLSGFRKEGLIKDFEKQTLLTNPERLKRIAG
jgi:CRP/FNR family transcriptional regulator